MNVQTQPTRLLSTRKVVAITTKHEGLAPDEIPKVCDRIERETGLPTVDVLQDGTNRLAETVFEHWRKRLSAASLSQ